MADNKRQHGPRSVACPQIKVVVCDPDNERQLSAQVTQRLRVMTWLLAHFQEMQTLSGGQK